ncbi:MAG: hypothetical protein LQ345_004510 [Seirophora villosa]|nr:MAG: hypothetical protein LQ345_004510 [Seirophora villosa]
MADPVSIATGVVSVLTAAAQIASFLINFTRCSKDAPQAARYVLAEVLGISGTLSQLQSLLLGNAQVERSRTQLLQVDHVVTIVSACVLTFSELSELLDELKTEGMHVLARTRWARKDKTISKLIQRLQHHKASLSLILNILNGNNIVEAKASVDRLQKTIERHYEEISSRMEALELREVGRADRVSPYPRSRDDTSVVWWRSDIRFHRNAPKVVGIQKEQRLGSLTIISLLQRPLLLGLVVSLQRKLGGDF